MILKKWCLLIDFYLVTFNKFCQLCFLQTYVTRDVLRHQYAAKLPSERHMSSFNIGSISNVVPDPDGPQGHDPDNSEYVSFSSCMYTNWYFAYFY